MLQHPDADLGRTLERALTGDAYQGFTFRRKGEPLLLENGTVNTEFAVRLAGELDLPVADAQGGMARVQAFVERIISA